MAGGIALSAAAGLLVWSAREPSSAGLLRPDDPQVVAEGARIYEVQCASCHGPNLEGQPDWQTRRPDGTLPAPPHDETGHTWHHPDTVLLDLTKNGVQAFAGPNYRSDMPAFEGNLTDAEIIAVLSYIKSRWPAEIRDQHDLINTETATRSAG